MSSSACSRQRRARWLSPPIENGINDDRVALSLVSQVIPAVFCMEGRSVMQALPLEKANNVYGQLCDIETAQTVAESK